MFLVCDFVVKTELCEVEVMKQSGLSVFVSEADLISVTFISEVGLAHQTFVSEADHLNLVWLCHTKVFCNVSHWTAVVSVVWLECSLFGLLVFWAVKVFQWLQYSHFSDQLFFEDVCCSPTHFCECATLLYYCFNILFELFVIIVFDARCCSIWDV